MNTSQVQVNVGLSPELREIQENISLLMTKCYFAVRRANPKLSQHECEVEAHRIIKEVIER